MVVRARFAGTVAYVCDVIEARGVGVGRGWGPPPGCGASVSGYTDDVPGLLTIFEKGTGAPLSGDVPKPRNEALLVVPGGSTRT